MPSQLVLEVKFTTSQLVSVSEGLCELSKFSPSVEFPLKFCGAIRVRTVAEFCVRMEFCAEFSVWVQIGSDAEILPEL